MLILTGCVRTTDPAGCGDSPTAAATPANRTVASAVLIVLSNTRRMVKDA